MPRNFPVGAHQCPLCLSFGRHLYDCPENIERGDGLCARADCDNEALPYSRFCAEHDFDMGGSD